MLVIAHRGYSGKFLENSKEAIKAALELKTKAIEIDVHLSKDDELVVTHDYKLGRTVKTEGVITDFTAAELKELNVLSLIEVLQIVDHKCLLNVEIKEETLGTEIAYLKMATQILEAVKTYGLRDVLFSSFDPQALKILKLKSPKARIAFLDACPHEGLKIPKAKSLGAESYNVSLNRITAEQVAQLQQNGFKVYGYTVKTLKDCELAKGLKLDGIFADNLEEAQNFFSC